MRIHLSLLMVLVPSWPGFVAAQVPVGGEFQVNTFTTDDQYKPSVAMDPTGQFVVVWTRGYVWYKEDFGIFVSRGIYGQRYTSSGDPLGGEFQVAAPGGVNARTPDSPAVSADANGGFVAVWRHGSDIWARRFGPDGAAGGDAFRVDTLGQLSTPAIASDAAGNFVVTWTGGPTFGARTINARLYDADNNPQGGVVQVSDPHTGTGSKPAVARDRAGNFIVAWTHYQDGSGAAVFARRYDAAGMPLGTPFVISPYTTDSQEIPTVAMNADGRAVVAWSRQTSWPTALSAIYARVSEREGAPLGPVLEVSLNPGFGPRRLSTAMDDDGSFVVVWDDYDYGRAWPEVRARRFDATGAASTALLVNSYTTGRQTHPAIATDGQGNFVAVWQRGPDARFEPGRADVFGQRFGADALFSDDLESGTLSAWSASVTGGGDLFVSSDAAMRFSTKGLQGNVNDASSLYVQDDSPRNEHRYRARFYFDTGDFDPGEAQGRFRARLFIGFDENPIRRVFAVVLRRLGGQYDVMARARGDDGARSDTGFSAISPGVHAIELAWARSSGGQTANGTLELWVDGSRAGGVAGIDNDSAALDFVRLGALSLKPGASGTMYWDEFVSRRASAIGP